MKKKPIYLYILVPLSTLFALLGSLSYFTASPQRLEPEQLKPLGLTKQDVSQYQTYLEKSFRLFHNPVVLLFLLLSLVLLGATIFFLFIKKDLLWANIAYSSYLILGLL